ncbi:phage baseplate assembly protein V [Aestuariimicrobium sp. Y1814]|uniref:phage baseplate assembly protein V n=1 Tax=Aestuariimicrobium sp. Y1814 TaxID=3418742 RepID=UPI003DA78B5C
MKQVQGLPELIITLAGRRLSTAEAARVVTLRVHSVLAQPAQCLIAWATDELGIDPATGDSLRVEIGGHHSPLFVGEVTVAEYSLRADTGQQVRVRAYDALHRLRKRQFTRLHPGVGLPDLVATLANGCGLTVDAPNFDLGDVYQLARSDLDLLVSQAARLGLHPVVREGQLRLVTLAGEGTAVRVEYGTTLHSAEIEVSQEPAFRSAASTWWRAADAAADQHTASDARATPGVSADPDPARVGGGGALLRADDLGTPHELAQAELDVRRMGEVTAVLVVEGNPALHAGGRVEVQGVRPSLCGSYAIAEVTHEISSTGFQTTVGTLPPPPPPTRPPDQVTLGIVDDVTDPEDHGRVRVRLPAYPDLVSGWAPVLLPAMGADKGIIALPEVADTVLVLLPGHDPAQAIVLGGLPGTLTPPAAPGGERGQSIILRTRDGQQVTLDGPEHSLSLTDGAGSRIDLGPNLLRITAATDLLIEAPGRALRIRAKSVDFEEAPA